MDDVTYEVQFLDGLGAWRRWAVKRALTDALITGASGLGGILAGVLILIARERRKR